MHPHEDRRTHEFQKEDLMTMKKVAKSGTAKGMKKLTLKKETLADLSAKDVSAEQIRGGATSIKHPTGAGR
jgi:hypothetical protein